MSQVTRIQESVHPYQVDPHRKLTIPALIDIMHIAAWKSAEDLGASVYDLHKDGITWAMVKYRLEVFRYLDHHETFHIESYPSGHEKSFVYRDYHAFDAVGNQVARASSTWLVFDLETRRMSTLRDYMVPILHCPEEREPLERPSQRLGRLKVETSSLTFPVRWHELDPNNHVTNTMYFLWALEAMGKDWLNTHQLKEIEVHFKAETTAGDQVVSAYHQVDDHTFLHEIKRASDGKTSALARTVWN
ncbi:MAG: acyl-ACP thioesterase domain-containing protein [Bacteroidota bacterium]